MLNLRHLLNELDDLGIKPSEVHISGQNYDNMVADGIETNAENAAEDED
jgi:hypothetical protein